MRTITSHIPRSLKTLTLLMMLLSTHKGVGSLNDLLNEIHMSCFFLLLRIIALESAHICRLSRNLCMEGAQFLAMLSNTVQSSVYLHTQMPSHNALKILDRDVKQHCSTGTVVPRQDSVLNTREDTWDLHLLCMFT